METPTIVRQTKNYLLIKVPLLPKKGDGFESVRKNVQMSVAEKRLWRIIQEGEREYKEGKTIKARSIDEALKIYERRRGKKN